MESTVLQTSPFFSCREAIIRGGREFGRIGCTCRRQCGKGDSSGPPDRAAVCPGHVSDQPVSPEKPWCSHHGGRWATAFRGAVCNSGERLRGSQPISNDRQSSTGESIPRSPSRIPSFAAIRLSRPKGERSPRLSSGSSGASSVGPRLPPTLRCAGTNAR